MNKVNDLRRELTELLASVTAVRPPALRRSREPDYLYATDLPMITEQEQTDAFIRAASEQGWRCGRAGEWILLDRIPSVPPAGCYDGPYGPEAACCLALLRRHPERTGIAADEIRRLIKAGEEGTDAVERVCATLHAEWAAGLRQRRGLPCIDETYFMKETE